MSIRLSIVRSEFLRIRGVLQGDKGGRALKMNAGVRRSSDTLELFLPASTIDDGPSVDVDFFRLAHGMDGVGPEFWMACPIPRDRRSVLEVGFGSKNTLSAAWIDGDGRVKGLDEVVIVGQYMERWIPGREAGALAGFVPGHGRYSRYAGALGGDQVLRRLQASALAVVGDAQHPAFAEMARQAVRAGLREVTLCPTPASRRLAERLYLELLLVSGMAMTLAGDGEDGLAEWRAIASADVVACIGAGYPLRQIAEEAAMAYNRVVVSVEDGERSEMVSRIFLPDSGCPRCNRPRSRPSRPPDACLSTTVAAHAFLLLERLTVGGVSASQEHRFVLDVAGRFESGGETRIDKDPACRLCCTSGRGDAVLFSAAR
jgi:hypothetical protein